MRWLGMALGLALIALGSATAQADYSDYGLESVGASLSTTRAGAHPDLTIDFALETDPASKPDPNGLHEPFARTRDISVSLPPGLLGNPNSVETCTAAQFAMAFYGGGCPNASQVGITEISIYDFNFRYTEPIYNMASPGGDTVARLGFYASNLPNYINVSVRSDGDYGLTSTLEGLDATEKVVAAHTTLWGVPAASVHDTQRQTPKEAFDGTLASPPRPPGGEKAPFMVNPTRCGVPLEISISTDSYQLPGLLSTMSAPLPPIFGCDEIGFDPTFTLTPTTRQAATPSGLEAELTIPQNETVDGQATSHLKDAIVTLPEGMTIAPGAADGLEACSAAQVGYKISPPPTARCPDASKIGTAEFDVPALSRVIRGAIYQRTPDPDRLLRIWLVTDELGVHVKLPGEILLDSRTGQVTSLFLDNPQVPLRNLKLRFKSGPRAPLATPSACGVYQTRYEFAPWSGRPPVRAETPMTIDEGCDTGGFSPRLSAGATDPAAGRFSPFVFDLTRNADEQNLAGVEVTLPPGAAAKLAGVVLCPEAATHTAACPAASQIGTTTVATGPGSAPLWVPQPGKEPTAVYLSGPYKGAPYSIVVKVPAQAGPFDLGTVAVRAALHLNPTNAQVTTVADPLPQILAGIPITYRTVHLDIDRPGFTVNPTSCRPMSVKAKVTSVEGTVAGLSDPYRVGSCAALGFKPRLSLRLLGKTDRGAFPALRAILTPRGHDANIAKAVVTLPRSEFLEQSHIRTICTRVQFAADACPKGSVYGHARAFSPLVDYPVEGPVYLRSSSNPLPDLVMALRGPARTPIAIDVVGRIDSLAGGIRASFGTVPDLPVSKFVLSMQGGRKGLLVNSRDLCASASRADVELTGQNGKASTSRPKLKAACARRKR